MEQQNSLSLLSIIDKYLESCPPEFPPFLGAELDFAGPLKAALLKEVVENLFPRFCI